MNARDVASYEDFQKLTLFNKLQFVNSDHKLDIIQEVFEKTDMKQVKNSAQLRLLREKKL